MPPAALPHWEVLGDGALQRQPTRFSKASRCLNAFSFPLGLSSGTLKLSNNLTPRDIVKGLSREAGNGAHSFQTPR